MRIAKAVSTPLIFTTYDIGRMTGTDPTTVHKWIDKGLLRGYRTPGGHRRVRAEDLRSFLAAHRMPVPRELGGEQLRVMVVDGDPEALRGTVKNLKRLRPTWDVVPAESGVDALLRFTAGAPDVLVYDLAIEDTDGLALFRQLQSRVETSAMRLVAVSNRPGGEVERRATAAGAAACLKKPTGGAELVAAIEVATGLRPCPTAS